MRKITNSAQEAAIDILCDFIVKSMQKQLDDRAFIESVMNRYNLEEDPFTKFPCSTKEYVRLKEEYEKQVMFERLGYVE